MTKGRHLEPNMQYHVCLNALHQSTLRFLRGARGVGPKQSVWIPTPPPTHRRIMYKIISTYVVSILKIIASVIYKFNPIDIANILSDSTVAPI